MPKTEFPDNVVQIVERFRTDQQNWKPRGDKRAFVWISRCGHDNPTSYLASVAFLDYLYSEGNYTSAAAPIGIFGIYESYRREENILFVTPISIWRENPEVAFYGNTDAHGIEKNLIKR